MVRRPRAVAAVRCPHELKRALSNGLLRLEASHLSTQLEENFAHYRPVVIRARIAATGRKSVNGFDGSASNPCR